MGFKVVEEVEEATTMGGPPGLASTCSPPVCHQRPTSNCHQVTTRIEQATKLPPERHQQLSPKIATRTTHQITTRTPPANNQIHIVATNDHQLTIGNKFSQLFKRFHQILTSGDLTISSPSASKSIYLPLDSTREKSFGFV